MATVLHWIPALATICLIVYLSHQSLPPGAGLGLNPLLHVIEYALLTVTLVWGRLTPVPWPVYPSDILDCSSALRRRIKTRQLFWLWFLGTLFAVGDEIHQSFVPSRDAAAGDVLADVAGITSILAAYRLLRHRIH